MPQIVFIYIIPFSFFSHCLCVSGALRKWEQKKRSQKKRMWNNSPFHTALITKYFQSQGVVIFSSNFSVLTGIPNITNFLLVKQANKSNSMYKGC